LQEKFGAVFLAHPVEMHWTYYVFTRTFISFDTKFKVRIKNSTKMTWFWWNVASKKRTLINCVVAWKLIQPPQLDI